MGIGTERTDEALTVHGNIRLTGHLLSPSDRRAKTDIRQVQFSAASLTDTLLTYLLTYLRPASVAVSNGVGRENPVKKTPTYRG